MKLTDIVGVGWLTFGALGLEELTADKRSSRCIHIPKSATSFAGEDCLLPVAKLDLEGMATGAGIRLETVVEMEVPSVLLALGIGQRSSGQSPERAASDSGANFDAI